MEGMEKGGGGEEPPPVRPHDHLSIAEESRPPVHWEPILNNSQSIGFQDLLGNNPITDDFYTDDLGGWIDCSYVYDWCGYFYAS